MSIKEDWHTLEWLVSSSKEEAIKTQRGNKKSSYITRRAMKEIIAVAQRINKKVLEARKTIPGRRWGEDKAATKARARAIILSGRSGRRTWKKEKK